MNNKPKEIKIVFPYIGDTIGGSHVSSGLLINRLKDFCNVSIICTSSGNLVNYFKRSIHKPEISYLKLFPIRNVKFFSITKYFLSVFRILYYLLKNRPSICHINDARTLVIWSLPCLLLNINLVYHLRSSYKKSILYLVSLLFCKKIICISKYVNKSLPTILHSKACLIYNPFDQNHYIFNSSKEYYKIKYSKHLSINSEDKWIISAGKWNNQKNFQLAIQAFIKIKDQYPNVQLLLVGSITDLDYFSSCKSLINASNYGDSIHITGYRDDLLKLIYSSDILMATATDEGHGRTLVEAMFLRTPLVAVKSGGFAELLENIEDINLAELDPSSLSSCVRVLLLNSLSTSKLVNKCYKYVIAKFSHDEHFKSIMNLYRAL